MSARDEAIEVMAQAYLLRLTGDDDRLIERIDDWDRGIAAVMYDAAESIIRADERRHVEMAGVIDREEIVDEVRESIAREIEARHDYDGCASEETHTVVAGRWVVSIEYLCTHEQDAAIARGGAQ